MVLNMGFAEFGQMPVSFRQSHHAATTRGMYYQDQEDLIGVSA